jgi:hypothetical protein
LNNVQFNPKELNMQMVLVENLALTFIGDAHAMAAGFGKILVKLVRAPINVVTAPIERMARACDVAGVLSDPRTKTSFTQFRSRRHMPTSSQRSSSRWCLFPFRSLNHLT